MVPIFILLLSLFFFFNFLRRQHVDYKAILLPIPAFFYSFCGGDKPLQGVLIAIHLNALIFQLIFFSNKFGYLAHSLCLLRLIFANMLTLVINTSLLGPKSQI